MATAKDKTKETEAVLGQFKKNLDHIYIVETDEDGNPILGPEVTVGDTVLTFKPKAPVSALAKLVGTDNRVEAMTEYVRKTLIDDKGVKEDFESLLDHIDLDGLAEILNALGEGYTSFPAKS